MPQPATEIPSDLDLMDREQLTHVIAARSQNLLIAFDKEHNQFATYVQGDPEMLVEMIQELVNHLNLKIAELRDQ